MRPSPPRYEVNLYDVEGKLLRWDNVFEDSNRLYIEHNVRAMIHFPETTHG